jgi:hypothetical protein
VKRGSVIVGYLDDGHWSAVFGLSYRDMLMRDMVGPQRIVRENGKELRQLCGTGGISEGRNEVARQFLDNTDGEWLFFIDTDLGFLPDTVDRLIASADEHQRPVMGGLCFAGKRQGRSELGGERFAIIPTVYAFVELEDEMGFAPVPDYGRDQVIPVSATGAACLLVHRRVLNKVRAKYGDAWFDPVIHPSALRGGRRVFSEDLSFCVRVQGVEETVHVDTSVKTCHEKGGVYLDEHLFLAQQGLLPVEPSAAGPSAA